MPRYLTNLAGLNFRPASVKEVVRFLVIDQTLGLKREPGNPYDESAIQVWATDDTGESHFIGYVEKMVNGPLAKDLDAGMAYTALVSKVYTEDPEPKRWMHPLIEIVTNGVA